MGQHFKIVNKTKKQVLEPMIFGGGSKHGEIISNSSRGSVLQALGHLITTCSGGWAEWHESTQDFIRYKGTWAGDEIIMVGDYHQSDLYNKASNQRWYKDISEEVLFELLHYRFDGKPIPSMKAQTDGFHYSMIGLDVQRWLRDCGTGSLWGRRKELFLKWFPTACHEGNLRQKYDFVVSQDFKDMKEYQEEKVADGRTEDEHYTDIKDL